MHVQSSYSFQALLDSVVIINDPQSLRISHWVTYCTASACTGCLSSRLKSLCDSSALVQIFIWLHTFLYSYLLLIWLHTFLCDYTHFYVVIYIFMWLHTFLYGYTHFYMVTYIFVWLHTFLYGYINFSVAIGSVMVNLDNRLLDVSVPHRKTIYNGEMASSNRCHCRQAICTRYVLTEEKMGQN